MLEVAPPSRKGRVTHPLYPTFVIGPIEITQIPIYRFGLKVIFYLEKDKYEIEKAFESLPSIDFLKTRVGRGAQILETEKGFLK